MRVPAASNNVLSHSAYSPLSKPLFWPLYTVTDETHNSSLTLANSSANVEI
jgi:hypothetical protein